MKVAIIGGGVFGAMTAIHLAERGWDVTIFERLPALMSGASQHANRLHLGFHYPRHGETARQCLLGVDRFQAEFGAAVLPGEGNAYFIADEGSLTTPESFLAFCQEQGLRYREIDPARYVLGVKKAGLGVLTDEVMYDPLILRDLIAARLDQAWGSSSDWARRSQVSSAMRMAILSWPPLVAAATGSTPS